MVQTTDSGRFAHGAVDRAAVLLINLGTPEAPEAGAVRRYLREFLSDPRVVELPRWVWWPILNGPVLALRPRRSAAKYASIWMPAGSPLLVWSRRQADALAARLADRGLDLEVALAMRYGEPSIAEAMQRLAQRQVRRLLVVPMYPQYSATTTASALDGVMQVLAGWRDVPEVRWVRQFCDHPSYIQALHDSVQSHWTAHGRGDHLVMSFHGLPRRNLDLGDPYHCYCQKTARLLAQALNLVPDDYRVTFQSRFGRARWLEPSTSDSLAELARRGVRRLDVICPGFTADCLETLEEIQIEGQHQFKAAGGEQLSYIPCLNDAPAFIEMLAGLVQDHAQGWPVRRAQRSHRAEEAEQSARRALAMGAQR